MQHSHALHGFTVLVVNDNVSVLEATSPDNLLAVGFDAALGTPLFLADVEKALSGPRS